VKILLILLAVLAVIVAGFFIFRLPQPIIEIAPEPILHIGQFDVMNTMFTAWLNIALIVLITYLGTRKLSLVPSGFQNAFEALIEGFGNIVKGVAGEQNGRRFFPLVFILFLYIVISNWAALLPVYNHIGVLHDEYGHVHHDAEDHPNYAVGTSTPVEGWTARSIEEYRGYRDNMTGASVAELHGWVMRQRDNLALVPMFTDIPFVRISIPETNPVTGQPTTYYDKYQMMKMALAEEQGTDPDHPLADNEAYGFIAPLLRGTNTDINAPLAMAIWSFIFVEFWGISTLGLFAYGSKFLNFRRLFKGDIVNGIIDVFVGILELVSELSRMISFTFRLFGNIFAGEVLLFMMTFLVPLVLINVFYGLELFVGLIQGFVFAMLTLVFAVMAVAHHGDHDEGAGHVHHADEHTAGGAAAAHH
jgi:F-type H+-transporting ATPase subunit a